MRYRGILSVRCSNDLCEIGQSTSPTASARWKRTPSASLTERTSAGADGFLTGSEGLAVRNSARPSPASYLSPSESRVRCAEVPSVDTAQDRSLTFHQGLRNDQSYEGGRPGKGRDEPAIRSVRFAGLPSQTRPTRVLPRR